MRTACVWFPDWALGREDAPSGEPLLVVTDRVVAASPSLKEAGVRIGMSRREAEALSPHATVLERDPGEEARRFEPVVTQIEEVVPRAEVAEPGLVFVPLSGAVTYYGSEKRVAETLAGKLAPFGDFRLGVADGPFAARLAAGAGEPGTSHLIDDTAAFLAGIDVGSLGVEVGEAADDLVAIFRWLGVTTLGSLAGLPREAMASRFGSGGIAAHRLASGEDRMVRPRAIPPDLAVEARYEDPLESLDQVGFAARALSVRLMEGLRREGIAPYRVLIEAEASTGSVRSRVWRSADPFGEEALSDRVWWQLRAWIDLPDLRRVAAGEVGGIVRLRLDPSDLSGDGRQLALIEQVGEGWGAAVEDVEVERALARAQALLGPEQVVKAVPQGGRMPAEQVSWSRWGESLGEPERDPSAPWPGATPGPVPALVPPQPPRLDVEWDGGIPTRVRLGTRWEPVLSWSGPWRLMGRWWRGEGPTDRYQLVTSAGALLCVVSDQGTFLAGVYD